MPMSPNQQRWFKGLMKPMTKLHTWLYRVSGGRLGGHFVGDAPVLLLTTIGKRTGQLRTVPLLYLEDQGNIVLVASQGGLPTHPIWYQNLQVRPDVDIQIGNAIRRMHARQATEDEKAALWPRLTTMFKGYERYQARTERNIPVVILSPLP
jgi:deazaflavin-dependent oxidoreductase (nitroreductase family)